MKDSQLASQRQRSQLGITMNDNTNPRLLDGSYSMSVAWSWAASCPRVKRLKGVAQPPLEGATGDVTSPLIRGMWRVMQLTI